MLIADSLSMRTILIEVYMKLDNENLYIYTHTHTHTHTKCRRGAKSTSLHKKQNTIKTSNRQEHHLSHVPPNTLFKLGKINSI